MLHWIRKVSAFQAVLPVSPERLTPSSVLLAIGRRFQEAACSVRISLGPSNTREEVDMFVAALKRISDRIRGEW
ncbi:MAG: hypothetical protein ACLFQB_01245 [Chitinispirillaceae bacterium]